MVEYLAQEVIYVCPNCTTGFYEPGTCPDCLVERVECRPGVLDDRCRKPLMSRGGRVETHAPLWWLRHRIGWLAEAAERIRQ